MKKTSNIPDVPSERLSREHYYDSITASISSYIRITNRTKNVFQIILGTIASILIVAISAAFILLIVFILKYGHSWQLDSPTIITTVITSSATYAASLIGTLAIVVNYMFNKNDIADHSNLLKSFLESDTAKDEPVMHDKDVSKIAEQSGLASLLFETDSDEQKDDKNGQL